MIQGSKGHEMRSNPCIIDIIELKKVERTHAHVPSIFFLILKKIDEKFSHNLRHICCLNV